MKNVKCLKCIKCGKEYEALPDATTCECGGILDVVYDYDYIRSVSSPESISASDNNTMWRYRPFLPVEEDTKQPPLRVGWSPLYEEPEMAKKLGIGKLYLKDDGLNPTASLKDRASSMGVAKAIEAGYDTIACSSTGNAASSLAGNAAAAGLKTYIFVPERAPIGKVAQLLIFGATVISVKGNYEETFELSKDAINEYGWYNRNAAINCYLMEGKKTVALEIAEQLGWNISRRRMYYRRSMERVQGSVQRGIHRQTAKTDLCTVCKYMSDQQSRQDRRALGTDGGEYSRRFYFRRRTSQRRQGDRCYHRIRRHPGRSH